MYPKFFDVCPGPGQEKTTCVGVVGGWLVRLRGAAGRTDHTLQSVLSLHPARPCPPSHQIIIIIINTTDTAGEVMAGPETQHVG